MPTDNRKPKARQTDLVVQEQGEETLIYDTKTHQAHCLTRLTGLIWRHCDGRRSLTELAAIVHRQLQIPEDQQLVEVTLQELQQANLLQDYPTPTGTAKVSRREV